MGDQRQTPQVEETQSALDAAKTSPAKTPTAKFPPAKATIPGLPNELSDDALDGVAGGVATFKNLKSPFE